MKQKTPFKYRSESDLEQEAKLRARVLHLRQHDHLSLRDIGKIVGRSYTWVWNVVREELSTAKEA